MNTVFIVPTGIGASIGGHAGDANPAFKLIASLSDIAITHPNVVTASDINEMPENTWYVEGSILDRFLAGKIRLEKPYSNRILLAVNSPIKDETVNALNAARHTIGCEIEIMELETPLVMTAIMNSQGATGEVTGWVELVKQSKERTFDAMALASVVTVPKAVAMNYLRNGGINPWGGVEAVASKLIATALEKPVAHAPVEVEDPEQKGFNEICDPRLAAEVISYTYLQGVLKGLHKAPRISDRGLSVKDIGCMVAPLNCYGPPHEACIDQGIPIIAVAENETCLDIKPPKYILARNYLEAAGTVQLLKTGMTHVSVGIKGKDYAKTN